MKRIKGFRAITGIVLAVTSIFALGGCGSSTANKDVVKIGVVGENNKHWEEAAKLLEKQGINIELVKFGDFNQPNQALEYGEIDLNAFQHYAFLNNEIEEKGYKIEAIGESIIAPLGLYSKTLTSIDELKDGDKVAIPNDTTNEGRALKMLETAGLITVKEDAGYTPTIKDIAENPKNIEFVEVEAAQTPRLLDDVEAAIINGTHAIDAGFNIKEDSIYLESPSSDSKNPFINVIVARTEDKDNEIYNKIVDTFRSEEVKKVIDDEYKGAYIASWE